MNNVLSFESYIDVENMEVLNEDFSKAECKVMYTGANRNMSYISKESVKSALGTIYNIPVIAEVLYKEGEDKDFGTHGGRLIIDSNGARIEQTTVPYGVVPESCNPRWVQDMGKEYLVCDIYLWTGRYDDLEILMSDDEKKRPQSMEINVKDSFVDEEDYEVIENFSFSALTILGSDVEPCFEDARVKMYEKDRFKEEYEKLFNLYNKINKDDEEEVKEMTEEKDMAKKEEEKDAAIEAEKEETFELSYKDKMDILYSELQKEDSYVWIFDFTDSKVDYEIDTYSDGVMDSKIYRAPYELNEESKEASINFDNQEELFMELITKTEKEEIENNREMALKELKDKIKQLDEELKEFAKDKEKLQEALAKEKQYRLDIEEEERKEKIDIMIDSFEEVLGNEPEFSAMKDRAYEMELEEIENACYVLIGKANFSKSKTKKDTKKVYDSLNLDIDDSDDGSIADKIEKEYKNKFKK